MCSLVITSKVPTGEKITITFTGKDEEGNPTETIEHHDTFPASVQLKTIVNRAVAYPPPTMHQGFKLRNYRDPIELGELTIKYYEDLYKALEAIPE